MESPKGYILYKIYYDNTLVYLGRTKQPLLNRIKTHCFKDPTVRSIEVDKINKIDGAILITKNITDKFIDTVLKFKNKLIIHYLGKNKPWKANYRGCLKEYYMKYRLS